MMMPPFSLGVGRENWLVLPSGVVAVAFRFALEKGFLALKVKLPSGPTVTLPS